nr:hypothetical protein [uncultured bacterium]
MKLNGCDNVTIINACVGQENGTAQFTSDSGSGTNHVSTRGKLTVKVVSIDSLFAPGTISLPNCIKIDVEGSELAVLKGAKLVIAAARPLLFISFHGVEVRQQCATLLESWNYKNQGGVWVPQPAILISPA